jgi:hypothetical protein
MRYDFAITLLDFQYLAKLIWFSSFAFSNGTSIGLMDAQYFLRTG